MRIPWPARALPCVLALAVAGCAAGTPVGSSATATSATFMAPTAAAAAAPWASDVLVGPKVPATRTAALCGSAATACPAAEMGKPSRTEPKATTVGAFTEVDLTAQFKGSGAAEGSVAEGGPPPTITPAGWGASGINGTPYPAQFFPSTGNFTVPIHGLNVTFLIPAEGVGIASTFDLASPVSVTVPAGQYQGVWILGNGIGGGAGNVALIATYKDGSQGQYAFNFTEWCSPGTLVPGEFNAVITPYLLQANGGKMAPAFQGCGGLYAVAVPIDASKTLVSLSLPGAVNTLLAGGTGGAQNDFITAISLQKAA